MVYVDLNPVRAGICKTLETSDFTSIQQRPEAYKVKTSSNKPRANAKKGAKDKKGETSKPIPLHVFVGGSAKKQGIAFDEIDYFELTDWTGRAVHP